MKSGTGMSILTEQSITENKAKITASNSLVEKATTYCVFTCLNWSRTIQNNTTVLPWVASGDFATLKMKPDK